MRITLAHDYFLQTGGAERVASAWLSHYKSSDIFTMAFSPASTFGSLDAARVHTRLKGGIWAQHLPKMLPLLPSLARTVTVRDADVALISTSGWAHQYRFELPTVAYVHSPARWLYAADDYRMGLSVGARVGLRTSEAYLRKRDVVAMERMDAIVSNSKVTQQRVWQAYRRDSEVISPPVEAIHGTATKPCGVLPEAFLLIVARNRGYKRLAAAADLARRANRALVIIGSGTEALHNPASNTYGLGRVNDPELKWLYQHADVLIATGKEDFGLTVLEANAEGTPVVAVPQGGYLETVNPGVNGFLTPGDNVADFGPALEDALSVSAASCRDWAAKFSLANHIGRLEKVMCDVAA